MDEFINKIPEILKEYRKSDFKNEKEMSDFIEGNIEFFCSNVLNDSLLKYNREFHIHFRKANGQTIKRASNARVDYHIEGKDKNYIVELKSPRNTGIDQAKTIGQLMLYDMVGKFGEMNAEIVIVSSVYSDVFHSMLIFYKLPYRYVLLNKEKVLEVYDGRR